MQKYLNNVHKYTRINKRKYTKILCTFICTYVYT